MGSVAGDKTVHDSQAWALPPTSGLQPPQLVYSTLHCFSSKDSVHRNPSKFEVNDFPTWHNMYLLDPLAPKTFYFFNRGISFHLIPSTKPFTFFTCLFHSHSLPSGSFLYLRPPSNPFPHSFTPLLFLLWAQACDMAVASLCHLGEWWLSSSPLFGFSFLKSP